MKMYADTTGRRTAQILADVGMLAWVGVWSYCGRVVHDATLQLLGPAQRLESAGSSFGSTMQDAGSTLRQVPLVGEDLQGPFQRAAGTGASIRDAGHPAGAWRGQDPEVVRALALLELHDCGLRPPAAQAPAV